MKLYNHVYAVPLFRNNYWQDNHKLSSIGLYEGGTLRAIPEGRYYYFLQNQPAGFNHYLTGHGLLDADRDSAVTADLSAHGGGVPVFGGYVDSHFGHFFLEVLSRVSTIALSVTARLYSC